jgi:hypothetical protein
MKKGSSSLLSYMTLVTSGQKRVLALNHRARAVIPYAYNSVARHDA